MGVGVKPFVYVKVIKHESMPDDPYHMIFTLECGHTAKRKANSRKKLVSCIPCAMSGKSPGDATVIRIPLSSNPNTDQ